MSLPEWERALWKEAFELFGPLDWRRQDFLEARVNQFQAVGNAPLKDFVLFGDPTEKARELTEEDVFKMYDF